MAEEHKADPWRGGDDGQSWQPSHIERGAAEQEQETGASTDQTDSAQVPATEAGDQQTQAWDQRPTTPIDMPGGDARSTTAETGSNGDSNAGASASASNGSTTGQDAQTQQQSYYRPAPEYGAYAPAGSRPPASDQGQQQPSQGYGSSPQQGFFGQYGQPGQFGQNGQPRPNAGQSPQGGQPSGQGPFVPFGSGGPNNGRSGPGNNAGSSMSGTGKYVFTAVVAALVAAALMLGLGWAALSNGWITLPSSSSLNGVSSNSSGQGTAKVQGGQAPDWQAISKQVSESVVSIQVQTKSGVGAGSGAVFDTQGHVVTNNHVVDGAQEIHVTLSNGQMYTAKVVGTDTTADLAILSLDQAPSDLKPVKFADSEKLAVGENVMAIGNPLGYENTATTGIVSALNRPVSVMDESNNNPIVTNAVQLDAAINPGNSGGPTFNAAGEVIGINSSIASMASSKSEAGSIGIGFAIPSNLVKRIADEIIKDGKAKHVSLGVTIQSSTAQADGVTRGGAKVTKVVSGSPADKAGIKTGDTIVAFNGHAVNNNFSLLGFVRAAAFGDSVKITVVRDGKTSEVNATLDREEQTVQGKPRTNRRNSDGSGQDGDSDQGGSGDDDSIDPFRFFFGQ
ncbi:MULTISPECIES: trypsin-like peptidase domain-containing protein [Bifidobacterium]|uniref:PDZ domain-containing protein n=1 Tax=Bifidobacterium apousia TaxID=2750996 RepID=A0A556R1Q7_9BIFI|nr:MULTISPECIES: trypsin-like peptidase domain-containing protein [Bifidobacterium]MBI0136865.1 trypsin-like peptidase domain-containing protein [Bifidobacterium sp. W8120]TSJ82826.1 PDZ domain-containing protein [Bifidobacterium apousia]